MGAEASHFYLAYLQTQHSNLHAPPAYSDVFMVDFNLLEHDPPCYSELFAVHLNHATLHHNT